MFNNVLIVADNSAQMTEVSDYASNLLPKSHFYILSVINLGAFSNYYAKIAYREMKELSEKTVESMEEVLKDKKAKFTSSIIVGDPVSEIISFAKSKGMDLIILETHSGITTNKIKVGKTTASLITHSHIPILLLSEHFPKAKTPKVLHPTTGSKYSEMATELAAKFAKFKKSPLEILLLRTEAKIQERAREIVEKEGIEATYNFSEGNEINAIINKALDADIIIGSRGSPRPSYKLRFLVHAFALDPTVKLLVAFLPKPFLLVCD